MQDMGGNGGTLLSASWASAGVLCPILGNTFKERCRETEEYPEVSIRDDKEAGM